MSITWSRTSAGNLPASAISAAFAASTPVSAFTSDLRQRVRPFLGQLLDLHAALEGGQAQERAVGPVEQERHVVLGGDVAGRGDQDLPGDVALDVQPEDVPGVGPDVVDGLGELHPAGLAPAADLHLRLHHHRQTQVFGRLDRLVHRPGDLPRRGRHSMRGEQLFRLVLVQIHVFSLAGRQVPERAQAQPNRPGTMHRRTYPSHPRCRDRGRYVRRLPRSGPGSARVGRFARRVRCTGSRLTTSSKTTGQPPTATRSPPGADGSGTARSASSGP